MDKLSKPQIKALQALTSYQAFSDNGTFVEPSVVKFLSPRGYFALRTNELIAEQWGGFATYRPFVALTAKGVRTLADQMGGELEKRELAPPIEDGKAQADQHLNR